MSGNLMCNQYLRCIIFVDFNTLLQNRCFFLYTVSFETNVSVLFLQQIFRASPGQVCEIRQGTSNKIHPMTNYTKTREFIFLIHRLCHLVHVQHQRNLTTFIVKNDELYDSLKSCTLGLLVLMVKTHFEHWEIAMASSQRCHYLYNEIFQR